MINKLYIKITAIDAYLEAPIATIITGDVATLDKHEPLI